MRYMIGIFSALMLATFAAPLSAEEGARNNYLSRVVPRPQEAEAREGFFAWGDEIVVVVEPDNEKDAVAVDTLVKACRERNLPVPKVVATSNLEEAKKENRIFVGDPCRNWPLLKAMEAEKVEIPRQCSGEGYVLVVTPRQILVAANTSAGAYYGVQTLIQLLPRPGDSGIPCIHVDDWSKIRLRALSVDMYSGEVYTMEMFKETVRRMAHYKMNHMILYLEDAFQFPSHPDIGEDRDQITAQQTRELCAFAKKHHVDIAPCYNSPAHMGHTLRHPNYQYLREGKGEKGKIDAVINVTHPDTYPLLRDLYTDLCETFSSPYNYVAADEIFGLGFGQSAPAARQVGRKALFLRHVKILHELLSDHGKRMFLSGDPFEPAWERIFGGLGYIGIDSLDHLPRDVILGAWHYGTVKEFPFGQQLKERGFEQMLTTSNQSMRRLFPDQNAAAANVESYLPFAHRLEALGVIHSDWNLPGVNTFFEYNWPGMAFFAEWAWSDKGRTWNDVLPIVVESFYGPGTEPLAEAIPIMSGCGPHFGVVAFGLAPPDFRAFFAPVEPRALKKGERDRAEEFGRQWQVAKAAFDKARNAASRNREHLDFIAFALDQQEMLGRLVECRHLLAKSDKTSVNRRNELVRELSETFANLTDRYEELWLRVNLPLGLVPNLERFREVQASIDKLAAPLN